MRYENPQVPDGINVSRVNPLTEFLLLGAAAIGLLVLLLVVLAFAAESLARRIPFQAEVDLAERYEAALERDADPGPRERYLRRLTTEIAAASELPEGMSIRLHYVDSDVVNAFATIGGRIVIHRGLVEKLPHENALAMVIAHEIAHVKHRDPVVALGRGFTIMLALATVSGAGNSAIAENVLGQAALLTTLSFSRGQERRADAEALDTLVRYYGHVGGAAALFEALESENGPAGPAFLSTHPVTAERIEAVRAFARTHGTGEFRPLPAFD